MNELVNRYIYTYIYSIKERVNKQMNGDRDPEYRPSSIGFPIVHLFPTISCYLHLYLTQRGKQGFRNVKMSTRESLLFMTLSTLTSMWVCDLGKNWWEKKKVSKMLAYWVGRVEITLLNKSRNECGSKSKWEKY